MERSKKINPGRAALTTLVAVYGFLSAINPGGWRVIDGVDLIIHEAGHVLFAPLGEFMYFLGGSLTQLLVPLAFTAHFVRDRQPYAATITLFWTAESLFNLSVYVSDARAQALTLLGGEDATHDWHWILDRLGLLGWDRVLGGLVYLAGLALYAASVVAGLHLARVLDVGPALQRLVGRKVRGTGHE